VGAGLGGVRQRAGSPRMAGTTGTFLARTSGRGESRLVHRSLTPRDDAPTKSMSLSSTSTRHSGRASEGSC
jgi:hypothetical protein